MKPLILPDSSFYIRELRRKEDPFTTLSKRYAGYDLATCGPVRVEVLRGIRPSKLLTLARAGFSRMQTLHTPESTWDHALEIATWLERAGTRVKLPDLIIATCALEAGATVLTLDSDFSRIPNLRVIRALG